VFGLMSDVLPPLTCCFLKTLHIAGGEVRSMINVENRDTNFASATKEIKAPSPSLSSQAAE
jgi:hypothetical protein